jgi:stress response protein YsnF
LLRVDAREDQLDSVADVLDRHSPIDVHQEAGNAQAYAAANAAGAGTASTAAAGTGSAQPRSIPVVEEDLQVGKRRILRGGVRVYSRVVEKPVEERVNLQDERVRVDRQRVNRAATVIGEN